MRQDIILGLISSSLATKLVSGISLAVMFMTGITVNMLIFHVLRKRNVIRRNTTLILTHLLASNLIGCLVEIPAHITLYINPFPRVAEVAGIIYESALYFTLFSSCGCFLLIFINRIDCITRPFEELLTFKYSKAGLSFTWGAGAVGTSLLSVKSTANILNESVSSLSDACYTARVMLLALMISAFLVGLVSYYRIYSYIRHHNRIATNSGISTKRRLRRREMRISKGFCAHVGLFAFSFIPYLLVEILKKMRVSDIGIMIHITCRVLLSFRHTLNAIVYGGMSEGVYTAVGETLGIKYSKDITSRRYRSTFDVDKGSKHATCGSSRRDGIEFGFSSSYRIFQGSETASNKTPRNMQSLSWENLHSNSNIDSMGLPSAYSSTLPSNGFRSMDYKHECSANAEHARAKLILQVRVSAKGSAVITTELSNGKEWSSQQCVRAPRGTGNRFELPKCAWTDIQKRNKDRYSNILRMSRLYRETAV